MLSFGWLLSPLLLVAVRPDTVHVKRWIMTWLRSWRGERFVLSSPLSVEDGRRRLDDGLAPCRRAFGLSLPLFPGGGVVRGYVGHDDVKLVATHAGVLNAWRPVLRGRLVATETGC
jgi:hypothetical protein